MWSSKADKAGQFLEPLPNDSQDVASRYIRRACITECIKYGRYIKLWAMLLLMIRQMLEFNPNACLEDRAALAWST